MSSSVVSITHLPSYSTERFYLLSELEELCGEPQAIYPDPEEEAGPEKCLPPSSHETEKYWLKKFNSSQANQESITLIYLLWNESDGITHFMNTLELTLGSVQFNSKMSSTEPTLSSTSSCLQRIIAVEILLTAKGVWTKEQEIFFSETLIQLSAKYPSLQFIFGLADNYASPALEALLHTATALHTQQPYTCQLVASHTSTFLGHNKDAEPDAISDVFQVLLVLQPTPAEIPTGEGVTDSLKLPSHEIRQINPSSPQRFDLIRSQGILFLLIAAISWFLFAYFNPLPSK
jgi:hypothetical protein